VLQNGNERISKKMIVSVGAKSNYHFVALSSNLNYAAESINKTNNSFTVLVQSLEETTPQIVKQIFTELVIDDNTTINFELEEARILLYKSIDGIKIGDDSLTVIQKLGEPSDIRPAGDCECYAFYYFEFPYDILRISFLKNAPRDSIYSVVDLRVYNNYEGKFTEGIGLGYSRDEVLRVLGEPTSSSTIGIDDVYIIETPHPGYLKTFTQLRYTESSVLQEIIMGY
jgi:hypothetical protein